MRDAWNEPVLWPVLLGSVALVASMVPAVVVYRRRERRTAGIASNRQ